MGVGRGVREGMTITIIIQGGLLNAPTMPRPDGIEPGCAGCNMPPCYNSDPDLCYKFKSIKHEDGQYWCTVTEHCGYYKRSEDDN